MQYKYRMNPEVADRTRELMIALNEGGRVKVDDSEERAPFYVGKVNDEYQCSDLDGNAMFSADENTIAFYVNEDSATVEVVS